MIIIPDVHGRTFWKEAVAKANDGEDIIFLGDYVDPYSFQEGIGDDEAFENFKEILKYKEEHSEHVTLLLGNHDFHYINKHLDGGRKSWSHGDEIGSIISERTNLFSFTHHIEDGGKTYVFSHAGFMAGWLQKECDYTDKSAAELCKVLDGLNDEMQNGIQEFSAHLEYVSYVRGGWGPFGSPIWSDVHEQEGEEPIADGVYQIFGHTQMQDEIINDTYACLDCRDAFRLNDGKLEKITDQDYRKKNADKS